MTFAEHRMAECPFSAAMRNVCIGCNGRKVKSPRFRPVRDGWVGHLLVTLPTKNNAKDGLLCQKCYDTLLAEKKVILHVSPSYLYDI